ncbi:hypothetical protein R6V09_44915 [Streptomyces sp. W16]|nr:hypothetical protein [Streptomyces sp. W16]MDV9177256.1 hypothetical protein [Streptomyces sp. W16]
MGPELLREVVARPRKDQQFGARYGGGRGASAADVAHDVGGAVHDRLGHPQ